MKDMKLMGDNASPDDDMKSSAKLKVLKHLKELASSMMGDDVKGGMDGLKKVTVAAPDKAGLQHGLEKAQEMMGNEEDMEPHDEEHMSADEIDAEIQHLMDLKKQLTMKEGMNP